jgi:hypothetical protein
MTGDFLRVIFSGRVLRPSKQSQKRLTEPTSNTTDYILAIGNQVQVEGSSHAKSGFLQKDDGVSENGIAAQDLRSPYYAVLSKS